MPTSGKMETNSKRASHACASVVALLLCAAATGASAQVNDALEGAAYRWWGNTLQTSNANRAAASGLNDGNLSVNVNLHGGGGEAGSAFEAAGVIWPAARGFSQVKFLNGSWASSGDGAYCAELQLQVTQDGSTWAALPWPVSPDYGYDSASSAGVTFKFSGEPLSARGVRVSGRLRCTENGSYWANVRELQVFADTPGQSQRSLWDRAAVPAVIDAGDAQSVELGMHFRSSVSGMVTGVRFYKAPANTGTHTASLWSNTGALLAQGAFTGESASGWQQMNLAQPLAIAPNTSYVVSYHASVGHYSDSVGFFSAGGVTNGPLQAPASIAASGNGVFKYGSGIAFPNQTWNASNYWVDVMFVAASPGSDITPPTMPANFAAVAASANRINLSWGASTDDVGVAKYRIYRGGSASAWAETTATTYADTTVVQNTTYAYAVQALDAVGNASALSVSASATTPAGGTVDTSPPSVPASLSAHAASATRVDLTWSASTDNVGVVKYQLFRNGGATAIAQPTGTSLADTAAVPSTTYSYQVRAVDAANNVSALSNIAWVATPALPGTLPAAPNGIAAASGNAQVTLNWNAVSGATGYKVYRNASLVGSPTVTSFTDTGLANGVSYSYQVSGMNSVGEGAKSAVVTATPVGSVSPEFPGPTNTGYRNAPGYPGHLTTYSATPIPNQECSGPIQSDKTYHFCRFVQAPAIGDVNTFVTNTTFVGCQFLSNAVDNANVTFANGNNVAFSYSSFEPSQVASPPVAYGKGYQYGVNQVQDDRPANYLHGHGFTVDHSDFWGFGNGIQIGKSTQAEPVIIKHSWFHDASEAGSSNGAPIYHVDAILDSDGGADQSYIVIDHNTIVSVGNTNGVALQYAGAAYNNIWVTNNYVSGFGYTLNIGGAGYLTNSVVTGNVFGTDIKPDWGPLYGWGGSGNVWRNNTWRVAPGTTWSPASDNGLYWWPDGTLSSTDYAGP